MKKQLFTIILALCVCSLPLMAVVSGRSLTNTLKDLCTELQATFMQRSDAQKRFNEDFDRQHKRDYRVERALDPALHPGTGDDVRSGLRAEEGDGQLQGLQ